MNPEERTLQTGDRLGGYVLLKSLGSGGCGEVWLARQPLGNSEREVALKFIRSDHLKGPQEQAFLTKFKEEIQLLMRLQAQGIVRLYDVGAVPIPGSSAQVPYFAMEHVPGTLVTRALRGREVRDQVACFVRVVEAVQRAHNEGVLHLDLKPRNLLVTEKNGELLPTVLDFGLGRLMDAIRPFDPAFLDQGSVPYLAPEQLDAKWGGQDARTDVHALGVMLFEVLTGRLPYSVADGNPEAFRRAVASAGRLRLRERVRDLDGQLEAIVAKAIEVEPARRHRDAESLARELSQWLGNQRQRAGPQSEPAQRRVPRTVILVVAVFMIWIVSRGLQQLTAGHFWFPPEAGWWGDLALALAAVAFGYVFCQALDWFWASKHAQRSRPFSRSARTIWEAGLAVVLLGLFSGLLIESKSRAAACTKTMEVKNEFWVLLYGLEKYPSIDAVTLAASKNASVLTNLVNVPQWVDPGKNTVFLPPEFSSDWTNRFVTAALAHNADSRDEISTLVNTGLTEYLEEPQPLLIWAESDEGSAIRIKYQNRFIHDHIILLLLFSSAAMIVIRMPSTYGS